MTKKQKTQRIAALKAILIDQGFTIDSYSNYKIDYLKDVFRFKFKAINIRCERKINRPGAAWIKIFSRPIVTVLPEKLNEYLKERFNK